MHGTVFVMQAVSCVRRGREVQQLLSSKTTMLNNLQHILHQIQMAESDVMVRCTCSFSIYIVHVLLLCVSVCVCVCVCACVCTCMWL